MDDIDYLGVSGTALSYNLYSYCENNSVNNVDPNGNVVTPANVIGAVLGAVGGYFLSRYLADQLKLSGWKRSIFIIGITVVISAAIGVFSGIIDIFISTISIIFPVLGTAGTLLIGVKNIGRFLSKKAFEKLVQKVFTKPIINLIVKAVVFLLTSILSLTVNISIGTIGNLFYGFAWMLTFIGNFIGGIFDFCDGKYDGYFRIKVS